MNDGNDALEEITMLSLRIQELLWRSPLRKKFAVGFIADCLLIDRTTAEAISLGRRLVNDYEGVEWFEFVDLLIIAVSHYRGGNR